MEVLLNFNTVTIFLFIRSQRVGGYYENSKIIFPVSSLLCSSNGTFLSFPSRISVTLPHLPLYHRPHRNLHPPLPEPLPLPADRRSYVVGGGVPSVWYRHLVRNVRHSSTNRTGVTRSGRFPWVDG